MKILLSLMILVAYILMPQCMAAPIASLPGLIGPLPTKMYSDYITVDAAAGRALFYVFAESEQSQKKSGTGKMQINNDPVVLWLTGGPGCSSLMALFEENGPLQANFSAGGMGIQPNPFSWTKYANMIWLESPAGVGFSYSNTSADYITGDKRTADDSLAFLVGFFEQFPNLRSAPFWVTGESYGGHYVPELVSAILAYNAKSPTLQRINIQGLMAGNPWTAPDLEAFGVTDNWWQRAIISRGVYDTINRYCSYQNITYWIVNNVSAGALGARRPDKLSAPNNNATRCFDALELGSLVEFGSVNILGIYLDVCRKGTRGDIPDQPNYCADGQLSTYLNQAEVQAALHVRGTLPQKWQACTTHIQYNTLDTQTSMIPRYKEFLQNETLKILIYSGDNDAIVPTTGTRRWIESLGLDISKDTHEWFVNTNGEQVAGWAIQYQGLTFTTIRGGGHLVPFTQPKRALEMFRRFLQEGIL